MCAGSSGISRKTGYKIFNRYKAHGLEVLMRYDLGYIDLEQRTLQTIDNPFGTRLSPMS